MKTSDILDIIEEDLRAAQRENERLARSADAAMAVKCQAEGEVHALIALQCHIEEFSRKEKTERRKKKNGEC